MIFVYTLSVIFTANYKQFSLIDMILCLYWNGISGWSDALC
jgi:hypothetical protein